MEATRQDTLVGRRTRMVLPVDGLDSVVAQILEGALELAEAELGNVQLPTPSGALEIAAQAGFGTEFLDHFAVVEGDDSACGRAALTRTQTVIPDVELDAGFAPHRAIAAESRFRAVVSTPLIGRGGEFAGVVSTHFRSPGRPTERVLHALRVYGRLGGEALTRLEDREANGVPGTAPGSDEALARAAQVAVGRIFSASLTLAAAQAGAADEVWRARLGTAVDELDAAIKDVQAAVIGRDRA